MIPVGRERKWIQWAETEGRNPSSIEGRDARLQSDAARVEHKHETKQTLFLSFQMQDQWTSEIASIKMNPNTTGIGLVDITNPVFGLILIRRTSTSHQCWNDRQDNFDWNFLHCSHPSDCIDPKTASALWNLTEHSSPTRERIATERLIAAKWERGLRSGKVPRGFIFLLADYISTRSSIPAERRSRVVSIPQKINHRATFVTFDGSTRGPFCKLVNGEPRRSEWFCWLARVNDTAGRGKIGREADIGNDRSPICDLSRGCRS